MPYNPGIAPVGAEAFSGWARGARNLSEAMRQNDERRRRDARLFKALQEEADVLGIANKDTTTTWDLGRLQGAVDSYKVKQAQQTSELNRRMMQFNLDQAKASLVSANRFDQWLQENPKATREQAIQAALSTGIVRHDPRGLEARMQALYPAQLNEIPISQLGQPREVPGMPDYQAVPVSTHSLQLLQKTGPKGGEAERVMINGQPSGWLRAPDGQYLRDYGTKNATGPDPAQFDANGDGILDDREWQQWLLASKLSEGGGAYPGMSIAKPQAGGAAPSTGISAEDFKRWKASKGK